MENFDSILLITEKSLNNIRGIFDRENIEAKITDLEKIFKKKIFERQKFSKKLLTKKIFENILNSIKNHLKI